MICTSTTLSTSFYSQLFPCVVYEQRLYTLLTSFPYENIMIMFDSVLIIQNPVPFFRFTIQQTDQRHYKKSIDLSIATISKKINNS